MKKRIVSTLAGTLALMLLLTAAAGALSKGGSVSFNQVNLSVFSRPEITTGQNYRLANGLEVPGTISYTSEAGGSTIYVPIRMMAELLDANLTWDNETRTADFAAKRNVPNPGGTTIAAGTDAPSENESKPEDSAGNDNVINLEGVKITVGTDNPPEYIPPETPVYGQKIGPFEEIDPDTVSGLGGVDGLQCQYAKDTRVQYQFNSFPGYSVNIIPERGQYLVYTVTNNGQLRQYTTVAQKSALGVREAFSNVLVRPGETSVRVFRVDRDASPLAYALTFGIGGELDRDTLSDVTISLEQYDFD